jgi:RNA-splicing ligase RtcB
MFEIKGKYTTATVMIDDVEESCIAQIHSFVNHPAFTNPVAIMPDTHAGRGSVIGFTMPMTDQIIPFVVGVDIGCGMLSFNVGKILPVTFEELDRLIRLRIPFGKEVNDRSAINMKDQFPWREANGLAQKFSVAYQNKFGAGINLPRFDFRWLESKCQDVGGGLGRIINSISSLGGGNHMIEVGIDNNTDYWVTVHTGSRNFGLRICNYWQDLASKRFRKDNKEEFKKALYLLKEEHKGNSYELKGKIQELKKEFESKIPPNPGIDMKGLEWLEGEDAHGYLFDMIFAQVYARTNREYIKKTILDILNIPELDSIETVHNYIDFNDFIIRKGAVRSYVGERFILPFNMRDGILICEGKSRPDWNYSSPHGAGRLMSRSQAKKRIDLEKFKGQMAGIYSTSVGTGTLDEAPDAYKNASVIEQAIEPTAKILNRIKPVHNMKATESED